MDKAINGKTKAPRPVTTSTQKAIFCAVGSNSSKGLTF
jgi:hypothetical protein